jgi:acetyl-CoA carboxylase biotin carboxyl carrier protein
VRHFLASGLFDATCRGVESGAMPVDVAAHITGTVWKIQVKVGDHVEEEQSVVILESMKMEMPVESPVAGRVATIAVSEGQAVEEGETLLTIE